MKAKGRSGCFLFSARWNVTRPTVRHTGSMAWRKPSIPPGVPAAARRASASISSQRALARAASKNSSPRRGGARSIQSAQAAPSGGATAGKGASSSRGDWQSAVR